MSDQETEYRDFTDKERRWLKKFVNVMDEAPDTLFMFCGAGSLIVYTKDDENIRYTLGHGGVDDGAPSMEIRTDMETDGGDW
jgi:hypothetical protein